MYGIYIVYTLLQAVSWLERVCMLVDLATELESGTLTGSSDHMADLETLS